MDISSRLLRYFVTVAEEGHFTRASQRLRVSQPALSTQIRQLEEQLQSTLFRRCGRHVELTAAGEAFLPRARAILDAWSATVTETRFAAVAEERVLRVGFIANAAAELTPQILAAFAVRQPSWRVRWHQPLWGDPTAGLLEGDADVALLRLPVPGADRLRTKVIFAEPRWLALCENHPLARQNVVRFEQLLDEPFVATPANTGPWRDFWLANAERNGRQAIIGAEVKSSDEWMEALANGYGVCFTGASSARYYSRPAVAFRPVDQITPSRVAVAWERYDRRDIVRDFVAACDEVAASACLPQM